jgi:peptide deformylase
MAIAPPLVHFFKTTAKYIQHGRLYTRANEGYILPMRTIIPAEDNPALREKAHAIPLDDIKSPHIKKLIADMKQLMAAEEYGVAIAASQVGEPVALFIVSGKALAKSSRRKLSDDGIQVEASETEDVADMSDQIYINPKLMKVSRGKKDKHEGCLSLRGKWGMVPRAEKATITAYDEHGQKFTRGASGFLAHIYQHEMDHLNGVLYTDKATEIFDEDTSEE